MKERRAQLARAKLSGIPALRHEQMLDEAARQLNANGVSLTSLSDIAQNLGVSRATLYQYIEDREDLVFQCYRRSCEAMARHLGEAIRLGSDAPTVLRIFIDRMLDPAQPEIAVRAEIACLSAPRHETLQGLFDAIVTRLASVLNAGAQAKALRECDSIVTANAIISLVTWVPLARYWAPSTSRISNERFSKALKNTVLDGLAADKNVNPEYRRIDLSPLLSRVAGVFDRVSVADAKRETLLAIASRLFNSKGIDSTSLEEIASHVGATKRTLYHHLGDKETLLARCYTRAFKIFLFIGDNMQQYAGSRLEAMAAAFHALSIAYLRQDLTPLAPLVGHDSLPAATQASMEPLAMKLSESYRNTLTRGQAEGTIGINDIEAQLFLLPGAFSWLVKDTGNHSDARLEHVAGEISRLLCLGLSKDC